MRYLHAILSDSSKDILKQWRNNPETFINYQDNDWLLSYKSFISAFIVPSFQNFGKQLLSGKLIPKWEINENNCFDLISVNRCSPVAALFYALKPELADKIPGFMGNMFICQNEINQTLNLIDNVFQKIDYQTLNFRASRLIMGTDDASRLLNRLPKALASADEKGCSLLILVIIPW